ncbi:MAG: hypothetical protein JWL99_2746 [Streptomyces oryziradicis]|nr:hypothetical protein [Actinacidiphila oryziradicis]
MTTVREHPAAGADHVTLMLPAGGEFTVGVDQLEQLRWSPPADQRDTDSPGSVTYSNKDG